MHQQARTLHMLQKSDAKSGAFVRPFDQSRKVRDDKRSAHFFARSAVGVDHAKIRLQRRERIIRDFRPRSGNHRDQRRFTSVRKTHKSNISEQSQLEPEMALCPFAPVFMFAWRLMPRLREMLIAATSMASMCYQHALSGVRQVGDRLARLLVERDRTDRHLKNHVVAGVPRAVRSFTVAS